MAAISPRSGDTAGTGLLRQLRHSEESARLLAQAIPNAFFYVNCELGVELANSEFTEPLGRTVDEVLGRHISEVLRPELYEAQAEPLQAALRGESVEYHVTVNTADGEHRHLRISNKPAYGADGRITGVLSQAVDISQFKRLEQKARDSERHFRLLAQGVPNHFIFMDTDLRITFCNDHFLRMSDLPLDYWLGRHISELLGPERYEERREYYERALRGETVCYESQGAVGNETGYFRFQYQPSFGADGTVQGVFSVAMDISERREVELALEAKQAELLRSNRDLEQFAYVASHDLKAPLRAIELLIQWIREDLGTQEIGDVQENLGLLGQRAQRLTRLLDDLLAYSRAGRRVGSRKRTDCDALVREVIEMLSPPDEYRVEVAGPLPELDTYNGPLEQVFRNLISNAIKHHPGPRARITVSCEDQGEHYLFSVEDDGAGIPAEYAERVFEMFQTLKPRDDIEGSGMGLAIVQRIVAWQGGRVWFETVPGGGTVFRFQWRKSTPDPVDTE